MKSVLMAAMALVVMSVAKADSITVTVGHMCCGACQAAATTGVKTVGWVDSVTIKDQQITVTAKPGKRVELVGLVDALRHAGFPAMNIPAAGPVKLTMAHLCCGSCVSDLKTKLAVVRSSILDHDHMAVDLASHTVVLQPTAGQTMNLVPLLMQIERAGFSASSAEFTTTVAQTGPSKHRGLALAKANR